MSSSAHSETELLTEHFGYPPVSLIDDIINSINILAERALNSVEQGLIKQPSAALGFKKPAYEDPDEAAKVEIESGTHQLETLICASIDRNFDKFEIYVLRNILCVRPAELRDWVRLSHYEGLDFSSLPPADEAVADNSQEAALVGTASSTHGDRPSLASINHLRRKLRESMRLNALLTAEREQNACLLDDLAGLVGRAGKTGAKIKEEPQQRPPQIDREPSREATVEETGKDSGPLAFLQRKGKLTEGGAEAPFRTNTAFTLSQMQALRALSTSLRTLTPDLLPPEGANQTSSAPETGDEEEEDEKFKSWRRQRLEYVEAATRRHLESIQGLELGRDGEVRDGEWQSEGRSVARAEVEGLEKVVAILGESRLQDNAQSGRGESSTGTGVATTPKPGRTPASVAKRGNRTGTSSRDNERAQSQLQSGKQGNDDNDDADPGERMDES